MMTEDALERHRLNSSPIFALKDDFCLFGGVNGSGHQSEKHLVVVNSPRVVLKNRFLAYGKKPQFLFYLFLSLLPKT
jgi:hypothetical protein